MKNLPKKPYQKINLKNLSKKPSNYGRFFLFDIQRFDNISNSTSSTLITGTGGDDEIFNDEDVKYATINGSAGNDSITNYGKYVSISGGAGNDEIKNSGSGDYVTIYLIQYTNGDGNDIIYNFGNQYGIFAIDTLQIAGGTYTTTKRGNDLIFNVGEGKIIIVGGENSHFSIETV